MTDDELREKVARAIAGDDFAQRDLYECAEAAIAAVREADGGRVSALEEQVADLLADVPCACGYDNPDDVCLKHYPLFRRQADELDRLRTEVDRLKNLLGRYADHVGEVEGCDFLDWHVWEESPISPEEAAEIASYCPSAALQETEK